MRRFARTGASAQDAPDHLDADEMNAFAEGALPPPARARYVSHLANCDECRKEIAQLAIASGAVARADQMVPKKPEPRGFWAVVTGMFALPALRYAAFAAIVIVVAGVGFFALRHRSESTTRRSLVAANEPLVAKQPAETNIPADTNGGLTDKPDSSRSNAASPPATTSASPLGTLSNPQAKQPEDRVAENTTTQPGAMKETVTVTDEAEKKAEQTPVSQSQVAQAQPQAQYAPVPPGEAQSGGRAQNQTGVFGGGFKNQQPAPALDKTSPVNRERDVDKDARADQANQSDLALRRGADEKLKSGGPSRNSGNATTNNRNLNETRAEAPNRAPETVRSEDAPLTRSAGGHKFRRQGNSLVDQKFKSSMSLKNISRGSEDYAALDGGLRSIAQQIPGEVIVVWKGKAYLIK